MVGEKQLGLPRSPAMGTQLPESSTEDLFTTPPP